MISGFLMPFYPSLSLLSVQSMTPSQKVKWKQQISEAVEVLHNHNLVWGDVKPAYIMVDSEDRPVLIDFGGGYTKEFVDRELRETIEGDKQGLRRLFKAIDELHSD